jgi:hypothetical protein
LVDKKTLEITSRGDLQTDMDMDRSKGASDTENVDDLSKAGVPVDEEDQEKQNYLM